MCLPLISAHLDCGVRAGIESDSSPRRRSHPLFLGSRVRPVVWLSCEGGMSGSHVSHKGGGDDCRGELWGMG